MDRISRLLRLSPRGFSTDWRVSSAVEYIRVHACEGLKVDDVVVEMGCSRSLAYLRFGEAVGHSIVDFRRTFKWITGKSPRAWLGGVVG